ncbi:MAG: demethoxyubiquinone hydroxylase family protein, partial [Burkholderiaceae bacterium]
MKSLPLSPLDQLIAAADRALRTLAADPQASRATPAVTVPSPASAVPLSERERREAAALMRVNHVGEVCAQAMSDAQALSATSPALREAFQQAAQEEADHLA